MGIDDRLPKRLKSYVDGYNVQETGYVGRGVRGVWCERNAGEYQPVEFA